MAKADIEIPILDPLLEGIREAFNTFRAQIQALEKWRDGHSAAHEAQGGRLNQLQDSLRILERIVSGELPSLRGFKEGALEGIVARLEALEKQMKDRPASTKERAEKAEKEVERLQTIGQAHVADGTKPRSFYVLRSEYEQAEKERDAHKSLHFREREFISGLERHYAEVVKERDEAKAELAKCAAGPWEDASARKFERGAYFVEEVTGGLFADSPYNDGTFAQSIKRVAKVRP